MTGVLQMAATRRSESVRRQAHRALRTQWACPLNAATVAWSDEGGIWGWNLGGISEDGDIGAAA